MDQSPREAIVTISYVQETLTKGGLRRFLIGAELAGGTEHFPVLSDRYLSFTTLDQWKASLADQAHKQGFPVRVTYRATGYFDAHLVTIATVPAESPDAVA